MSDDESYESYESETISSSMNEDDEEYHREKCENGDGWSHGFHDVIFNEDGQLESVDMPRRDILQFFEIKNLRKMGRAIRKSSNTVKRIDLSAYYEFVHLPAEDIIALFGGEWLHSNCILEKLDLSDNSIWPTGIAHLRSFLKSRPLVENLCLHQNNLGDEGARLISEVLNHVRINNLDLCGNDIGDEGVESLLSAEHSSNLVRLVLSGNKLFTRGFDSISHFLGRDDTKLERLEVMCYDVDDVECIRNSVDSISEYSKLGSFVFWNDDYDIDEDTEQFRSLVLSLKQLVCNVSSLESICQSNHYLCNLGNHQSTILDLDPTLEEALEINKRENSAKGEESVIKIQRHKLRAFYFRGEFDVQPFAKMDAKLMPNVLELVTKTEIVGLGASGKKYYEVNNDDLGSIYRLVRNCHLPELFSYTSPESKIQHLELENAKLQERIEQLVAENDERRSGSSTMSNKRAKSTASD